MFDYLELSPRSTPHFVKMTDGTKRHSAEIKGDQAIEFIEMQTDSVPWCLSVSFNAVHAVDGNLTPGNEGHYPYPAAVAHMYEGMVMPPPRLSDTAIFEAHPEFMKHSMNRERYFWRWDTEEKYQVNMTAYLRMISGYDRVMQRVIDALAEKGYSENTVIIYNADNGYYMGNRGFAGKWTHYEESLRVPLVIYDPRMPERERGRLSDEMVLNIDIPATILDLAGLEVPSTYQGTSLLPVLNETVTEWREEFLVEHRMNNPIIPKYVGFHTKRYVYADYYEQDPPYEYLHDLEKDPDELKNLVNDPEYSGILDEMRQKCTDLEEKIK
jgi:arylsulfatase A-like enzyme